MRNRVLAHGAMLVVSLLYAANYTIAKMAMPEHIGAYGLVLARLIVATTVFFVVYRVWFYQRLASLYDLGLLAVCSFLGVVVNTLLFFKGLSESKPIDASLLMALTPLIILVVSYWTKSERPSWSRLIGLVTCFSGLYLTLVGFSLTRPEISSGSAYLIASTVAYAGYLVLVKRLMRRYNTFMVLAYTFVLALPFVAVVGHRELMAVSWSTLPGVVWASIVFVVLAVTVVTYLLINWAIRHLDPSQIGVYNYLQPILAVLFAVSAGRDHLTTEKSISIGLVLAGLYVANRRSIADERPRLSVAGDYVAVERVAGERVAGERVAAQRPGSSSLSDLAIPENDPLLDGESSEAHGPTHVDSVG